MMSCNAAQSGTPNDRQLLTVKVPFDMSKKRSLYHNVGSLSINWSQPDFSFAVNGVSSYPGLGAYATAVTTMAHASTTALHHLLVDGLLVVAQTWVMLVLLVLSQFLHKTCSNSSSRDIIRERLTKAQWALTQFHNQEPLTLRYIVTLHSLSKNEDI